MIIMTEKNIETIIVSYIIRSKENYSDLINGVSPDFFKSEILKKLFVEKFLENDFNNLEVFLFKINAKEDNIKKLLSFDSSYEYEEILEFYKNVFSNRIVNEHYDNINGTNNYQEKIDLLSEVKESIESFTNDLSSFTSPKQALDLYREKIRKVQEENDNNDGVIGISTGLDKLDDEIYGIAQQDYILLAARPSMGKTSLALKMFLKALEEDKVAVFVSLETSLEDLLGRLLTQINSDLELQHTIFGRDKEYANPIIDDLVQYLEQKKLYIIDFHEDNDSEALNPTPSMVAKKLKKIVDVEGQIDIVFWDHIGLLGASNSSVPEGNRAMTAISRELKLLIRKFNCPFVVLSQLNRSLESRVDKRPKLSDLRESGALEQDADKILFVYRSFVYLVAEYKEKIKEKPDDPSFQREIDLLMGRDYTDSEIIISKNRNGPTSTVDCFFHKKSASFMDNIDDDINLEELFENEAIYNHETVN